MSCDLTVKNYRKNRKQNPVKKLIKPFIDAKIFPSKQDCLINTVNFQVSLNRDWNEDKKSCKC